MGRAAVGIALGALATMLVRLEPALADGMDHHRRVRHHYSHWHGWHLPPERHVVELGAFSGSYLINGTRFTPKSPNCTNWLAGERIKFLAGSLDGACYTALIHNVRRRQTCEFWCY
jgi:hypothetical protein